MKHAGEAGFSSIRSYSEMLDGIPEGSIDVWRDKDCGVSLGLMFMCASCLP